MTTSNTRVSKLHGADELIKVLQQLPEEMEKKVITSATRKVAKEFVTLTESKTGRIGYYTQRKAKTKDDSVVFNVGPKKEHWELVFEEFGTKPHSITFKGKGRGSLANRKEGLTFGLEVQHPGVAASGAFRNALDTSTTQLLNLWADALGKGVITQAKKLNKQFNKTGLVKKKRKRR